MAIGWRVTRQADGMITMDDQGLPVTGVQVYYVTDGGLAGSVFIPYAWYDPATVAAVITERVRAIGDVAALASD